MQNYEKIWNEIINKLSIRLSTLAMESWIYKLSPICIENGDTLVVLCPNESVQRVIEKSFLSKIDEACATLNFDVDKIKLILEKDKSTYTDQVLIPLNSTYRNNCNFNPKYNFDNFIVGNSNFIATNAILSIVDNPVNNINNPILVHSNIGLGKTHILHALGAKINLAFPNLRVLYTTTDNFINDMVYSIRKGNLELTKAFREKYHNIDVLLIDDIQLIAGKNSTQETLFHIFNDLYRDNKQIILTSDRHIKDIPDIEDRLRSRFSSGLIVEMEAPDLVMKIDILRSKAFDYHIAIDDEIINYLASKNTKNVRELESMLKTVIFYIQLNPNSTKSKLELAKEAIKDYDTTVNNKETLSIDKIIEMISSYYNISKESLVGKKRNKEIVIPRQIAIYIISELLPTIPLSAIGQAFGGRDHSTIIHAKNKIIDLLNENNDYSKQIVEIKNRIRA